MATSASNNTTAPTYNTTTPSITTDAPKTTTSANTIAPLSVNAKNLLGDIFTKSNIVFLLWFLAIYVVLYFIIGIFFNKNANVDGALRTTRIFDGLVFLFLLLYIIVSYTNTQTHDFGNNVSKWLSSFKSFAQRPYSIFSILIFMIVFYFAIYIIRIPMTYEAKPISIKIIETFLMIVLIILLICDFFKYLLNIDLINLTLNDLIAWFKNPDATTSITSAATATTSAATTSATTSAATKSATTSVTDKSEVFNIRNNIYTYDDAKAACSIYGAKLATYEQIENAYNLGGEWCNSGWSDGQMALFPTQKSTWSKLQGNDATKNVCGRPGINGGYVQNKALKYGVNCYGNKPPATSKDLTYMKTSSVLDKIPESEEDRELKAKIKVLKSNPDKFLNINSFNSTAWSEY